MKKLVTIICCILMLFNLISINSFAAEGDEGETSDVTSETEGTFEDSFNELKENVNIENPESVMDDLKNGFVNVNDDGGSSVKLTTLPGNMLQPVSFKTVIIVITYVPLVAKHIIGNAVVNKVNDVKESFTDNEGIMRSFTIYNLVMGKYQLFNIDYHNVPQEITKESPVYDIIKHSVVKFYYYLQKFSIGLSVLVLIYIGIRMAISTVASDKAKYNKMLIGWVSSLVLLVFMHIIVIAISMGLEYLLGMVNKFAEVLGVSEIENAIFKGANNDLFNGKGFNVAIGALTIWVLVYYQVKFFIYYVSRSFEIGFLIVIAPLITVMYSIDKAGDGKAQVVKAWFTELTMKAYIQIAHAILYCVFIASAGVIASHHPLIAVLFFTMLSRSEKIVRNVFGIGEGGFQKAKVPFTK